MDGVDFEQGLWGLGAGRLGFELQQAVAGAGAAGGGEAAGSAAGGDGTIDGCDECPEDANKVSAGLCGCGLDDSLDADRDRTPDCLDLCENADDHLDSDGDGTVDCFDDCPDDAGKTTPGQCGCGTPDADADADGFASCTDNCPDDANANQSDLDSDGLGDVCDDDIDGDGVAFAADLCRGTAQGAAVNADGCSEDQVQIVIEPADDGTQGEPLDGDGDGVADDVDDCPTEAGTAANNGCPETQDLCGSGLCNPGGTSLAMLLGLMLMRFGYRRPIRRA